MALYAMTQAYISRKVFVTVTYSLSSVWHSILDNFRPTTVWVTDLFIYYAITRDFGEKWEDGPSWIQLGGLILLFYGTALYNAPDPLSVRLEGQWYSCCIDLSDEYEDIDSESEREERGEMVRYYHFARRAGTFDWPRDPRHSFVRVPLHQSQRRVTL